MSKITFDGNTADDRKLWHSYIYWARERVLAANQTRMVGGSSATAHVGTAIVDEPQNRVDESVGAALQAVVFTAFALEYRLKRVLRAMEVNVRSKRGLSQCLENFWKDLENTPRLDGGDSCSPPADWNTVLPQLKQVGKLRNKLAHADYNQTLRFLRASSDPAQEATSLYNALVDAIKLINIGTGYETRPRGEVDAYFKPLYI